MVLGRHIIYITNQNLPIQYLGRFFLFIVLLLCACSSSRVTPTLPMFTPSTTKTLNHTDLVLIETITPTYPSAKVATPSVPYLPISTPTFSSSPTATPWYSHFASLLPGQYVLYHDSSFGGTFAVTVDEQINRKLADKTLFSFRAQGRQLWAFGKALFDWEQNTFIEFNSNIYACDSVIISPDLDMAASTCWVEAKDVGSHVGKLVVYSTANGTQTTLFEREDFEYNFFDPQWSPDGRWLAVFLGYRNYGAGGFLGAPDAGLYLFDTSCMFQTKTCSNKMLGPFRVPGDVFGGVSWSPDSQQIAMVSDREKGFEIFDLQRGTSSLLSNKGYGNASTVFWSPDGLWLAYAQSESEVNNTDDVYVIPAEGGPPLHLVNGSGTLVVIGWITVPLPLQAGKEYIITQAGANLHLRSSPSLSSTILHTFLPGNHILLVDGPVGTDGYRWWKIRIIADGIEGWAVEHPDWYEPVTP